MYNALTPDLSDPFILADTTLPALHEAVGLKRGELKVTYDPTLKNAIRIKPSEGAVFDIEHAKRRVADLIEIVDDAATPFTVSFLKARVHLPGEQPYPFDLMLFVASLQLFYLKAQAFTELFEETLQVVVSLTMPSVGEQELRADVDCCLANGASVDPEKDLAVKEYYAAVQPLWSRLARTVIGCWARDAGVTEFRLSAQILVDSREAMSAIGQPVEEPEQVSLH